MSTVAPQSYRFRDPRHSAQAKQALRKMASLTMRPKLANLGGDQESQFEQSFASLAFAYLQDKAPKLLDYMLGFQLVDRNDDNTKAIGIFGFKIGEEFVYAPVFFLNGDLKGHELLYIKKQDQFVPMKENWVNYLLNKQPHILGEGSDSSPNQLNIRQPYYGAYNFPPGKTAAARGDEWHTRPLPDAALRGVLPMLAAGMGMKPSFMAKHAGLDARLNLKRFLGEHVDNVKVALDLFGKYPLLKQAAHDFYGDTLLVDCLQELKRKAVRDVADPILGSNKQAAVRRDVLGLPVAAKQAAGPKVTVKFDDDLLTTENTGDLSEEEQEKLLREGVLVTDNREEHSIPYNVQQPMSLQNPMETGLYDVLVRGGKFKRCLVVIGPTSDDGNEDFATVVDVETKAWKNVHPTQLFVRECEDRESYQDWLKKLPEAGGFDKDGHYMVLTSTGMGSVPFSSYGKTDGDEDAWDAAFKDWCSTPRASYLPPKGYTGSSESWGGSYESPRVVLNRRKGSKLVVNGRSLFVPTDSYKLTLKNPPKAKEEDHEILGGCCCSGKSSYEPDPPPLAPGNLVDLQMEILQKTAHLKIYDDGLEVFINNDPPRTKKAALVQLIVRHGFNEATARELLKTAACKRGATFRVKYAEPYPTMMGPGAPSIPDPSFGFDPDAGSVAAQYPQEEFMPVPDMAADQQADPGIYDPTRQPDPQAMQVAQQAGQSGQKEVFDTAMIGSMLKAVREDSLVDRYLGDLLKALDRLGRILFLFYWHSEEFQDRYGKSDMPELEDSLRNAFESVGEITLYLKQKQIEPYAGGEMGEPEIDETARN